MSRSSAAAARRPGRVTGQAGAREIVLRAIGAAAVAACAIAGNAVSAQDAVVPAGLQVLRGTVIAGDESRAPVRRARVAAEWTGGRSDPAFTDDRGRFELVVPSAAAYTLSVSKPGFAAQRLLPDPGVSAGLLDIRMIRGAVITGTVLDPRGDPVAGLGVIVRRTDPSGTTYGSGEWVVETDDRGEFRVGSLPEGPYAVVLTGRRPGAGAGAGWQSGIHINSAVSPDTVVRLRAGEELALSRVHDPPPPTPMSLPVEVARAERAALASVGLAGNASIGGRIVLASGRPAAGASVLISSAIGGYERTGVADAEGRYQFGDLPAGTYRVAGGGSGSARVEVRESSRVTVVGLGNWAYPPDRRGRIVTVGDGERLAGIDVAIPRGSAMTGAVTDEFGEPLEGLTVQLWETRWREGRTVLTRVAGIASPRSDDRGLYRLYGVAPGTYYIAAIEHVPRTDHTEPGEPRRTFHPGSSTITQALPLHVEEDRDVSGVDVVVTPPQVGQVHGRITSGAGDPFQGTITLAASVRGGGPVLERRTLQVRSGTFTFDDVLPGDYVVHAFSGEPSGVRARTLAGESPVEFGTARATVAAGDSVAVSIHTGGGSSMSGRVTVKGGASPLPPGLMLRAEAADPDIVVPARIAMVAPDGAFELTDLIGPTRLVLLNHPRGWRIDSADIGGVNAADDPVTFDRANQPPASVEVVITQGGAEIAGQVTGRPGGAALVLVYPTDARLWHDGSRHFAMAAADRSGRFTAAGLPEGEFWVVAVDAASLDPGAAEWRNPDVLARLTPRARRVTVADGGRATVELRDP